MCICMYANIENIDGTYTILTNKKKNKKLKTVLAVRHKKKQF